MNRFPWRRVQHRGASSGPATRTGDPCPAAASHTGVGEAARGQRARALQPSLPRRGHARSDSSSRQRRSTDVAQRSRLDGPPFWTLLSVVTRVTPGAVPPWHRPASGERRLPSRTWPRKPADGPPLEPGTNLSPVTGSILLRVSRSRMESNGTFRKNTLRRKNKPQGQLDSPAAPDSRGPDGGRQQL